MESKTTIAVLEERMNTKQAEYKTDIGHLRADTINAIAQLHADTINAIAQLHADTINAIAQLRADSTNAIAQSRADNKQLRADMAQRETRMIITILAMIGLAVALLKFD